MQQELYRPVNAGLEPTLALILETLMALFLM